MSQCKLLYKEKGRTNNLVENTMIANRSRQENISNTSYQDICCHIRCWIILREEEGTVAMHY
eukprot:scaffold1306_cov100-Cylindrotheca_fusiformis.AAC.2